VTPPASVSRLREAINSHDPHRVADCFAQDYQCETPLHPAHGFIGSATVLRNWTALFATFARLQATVTRTATDGDETWSEWELTGSAADGTVTLLRGPVIWTEANDVITWAHFYLDRVDT
jgi:hypothetical protein